MNRRPLPMTNNCRLAKTDRIVTGLALTFLLFAGGCAGRPLANPFSKSLAQTQAASSEESPLQNVQNENEPSLASREVATNSQVKTVAYQEVLPPTLPEQRIPARTYESNGLLNEPMIQSQHGLAPPMYQDNSMINRQPGIMQRQQPAIMPGQQPGIMPGQQPGIMRHRQPAMMQGQDSSPTIQGYDQPQMQSRNYAPQDNRSRLPQNDLRTNPSWNQPTQSPSAPNHFPTGQATGVHVSGEEFRIPNRTATEILIDVKDENRRLKKRIAYQADDIDMVTKKLASEKLAKADIERILDDRNAENQRLRKMIAALQVQVEKLEEEKATIARNADETLQRIESSLDDALMSTFSKAVNDQ